MDAAEADAYWCLCKLLDGIQDHYTHAQPGIQRTVFRVKELVRWPVRLLLRVPPQRACQVAHAPAA